MMKHETFKNFIREVIDLTGTEYHVIRRATQEEIDKDPNMAKKVLIRHNCELCDFNEYWVNINKFVSRGDRCSKCYKINRKTMLKYNVLWKNIIKIVLKNYIKHLMK